MNSLSIQTVSVPCCKPLKRLSDSVVTALKYPGLSKRPLGCTFQQKDVLTDWRSVHLFLHLKQNKHLFNKERRKQVFCLPGFSQSSLGLVGHFQLTQILMSFILFPKRLEAGSPAEWTQELCVVLGCCHCPLQPQRGKGSLSGTRSPRACTAHFLSLCPSRQNWVTCQPCHRVASYEWLKVV